GTLRAARRRLRCFVLSPTSAARPSSSTLSLHDALPISLDERLHLLDERGGVDDDATGDDAAAAGVQDARRNRVQDELLAPHNDRSEEHTSELQSPYDLVCRLLLEKKKLASRRAGPSAVA